MSKEPVTAGKGKWDDLIERLGSGIFMVVIAIVAVVLGGVWFQMLTVFAAAIMIWELWMMIRPDRPELGAVMTALSASVMSGQLVHAEEYLFLFFFVTPVIGALAAQQEKRSFFFYALGIQIAGWGLIVFRAEFGAVWLIWLLVVVVATDVAGYFAGRFFGGPKFWPSVSPKKTWAGTAGGWGAAVVVGVVFAAVLEEWILIPTSVLLSFSSQMGDIAESALKRRMGVKDSSSLVPGHGGLMDRFDGVLGASLCMLLLTLVFVG